jgi:1-acyl-sn-glycerol-3-phosphate acyltransferase
MDDPISRQPAWRIIAMQYLSFGLTSIFFWMSASRIRIANDWKPESNVRYIIAANHLAFIDPFVCTTALGWSRLRPLLPCRFMASTRFLGMAWLRGLMVWLGSYPSHEFRDWPRGIAGSEMVFARGHTIVIFPQGRLRRTSEDKVHRGIEVLAAFEQAQVVPVLMRRKKQSLFGIKGYDIVSDRPFDASGMNARQIMDRIYDLEQYMP